MKTPVRNRIFSIATVLVAGGLAASTVEAATILVDDFESYASEAAFDAAWFPTTPAHAPIVPATLDTAVAHAGTNSARIDYNTGTGQFFGQLRHDFPTQNWTNQSALQFWYLGQSTNSQEIIGLRFYNSFGAEMGRIQLPIVQTQVTSWTLASLNLGTFTPAQKNDITQVRIAITPSQFGTGVLWFDDIQVVPEPATLALLVLGACGCLVGRRRII